MRRNSKLFILTLSGVSPTHNGKPFIHPLPITRPPLKKEQTPCVTCVTGRVYQYGLLPLLIFTLSPRSQTRWIIAGCSTLNAVLFFLLFFLYSRTVTIYPTAKSLNISNMWWIGERKFHSQGDMKGRPMSAHWQRNSLSGRWGADNSKSRSWVGCSASIIWEQCVLQTTSLYW